MKILEGLYCDLEDWSVNGRHDNKTRLLLSLAHCNDVVIFYKVTICEHICMA